MSFNVPITHLTGLNYVSRPPLARSDDLSALPGIERAANTLSAAYGLTGHFSNLLTPIESLRKGVTTDRLWVAADEEDRPVGFALASIVGDNAR